MSEPVLFEIVIAAPADTVWRAMRDRNEIRRWFGWDHEGFDAEVDFIFFGDVDTDDAAHALDFGPMGRLALAEDIAPQVVYLLSDESRFVTGQAVGVDGGVTI